MSREKERIPIIMNKINCFDFIQYLGFDNPQEIADKCIIDKKEIEEVWMNHPDLRLTQLLIIGGILENSPGP
jgi:aspartate ammonia-lyase